MPICQKKLDALLAEIERLKLENALLRKAAGIEIEQKAKPDPELQVSNEERNALLRKTL